MRRTVTFSTIILMILTSSQIFNFLSQIFEFLSYNFDFLSENLNSLTQNYDFLFEMFDFSAHNVELWSQSFTFISPFDLIKPQTKQITNNHSKAKFSFLFC